MTPGRDVSSNEADDIGTVQSVAEFSARLSELRTRSGRSLRELSTAISADGMQGAVHASYSTLGEWCRGDRLPQLSHLVAFAGLAGDGSASKDVLEIVAPFVAGRLITVNADGLRLTHEAVLGA